MSATLVQHPKYRTKLCRNFASGSCPFGPRCTFVHAVPRIVPPSFSLVQRLFHWNALLPQLLAFSNQQAMKKTLTQSPPPQGPQLVDEDPSPSTSLLLSTSDSASSDQAPQQRRRPSKRKKYPCRHFVRTGGWCPAGAQCKFLHDVAALPRADIGKAAHPPTVDKDAYGEGRLSITGGALTGIQRPSPPIVGQARLDPLQHTEAELLQRPNQPFYCPNYAWQPYHYYPVPTAVVPMPTATVPSVVQHSLYPPPQAPSVPRRETQTDTRLPVGAYEMHGTTYFPALMPPVPVPAAPAAYPIPAHPASYTMMVPPVYPYACYVPQLPRPSYYAGRPAADAGSRSLDPFASDQTVPSELPVVPRMEDYPTSSVQHEFTSACSSPSALEWRSDLASTMTAAPRDKDHETVQEHEFPYQPPRDQRVGHARRISVNIKKEG